eukprot:CAMPEP_0174976234 /NCGR_PEP_ID=MMETSP0004_2-20121128/12913_1 /TAXON_ID=420556 /ORGANISM="Ochromonas sp., Strain CCMP1393" /LENGTH=198 /DNA_ID=CAMNT_0016227229 /DNA_START=199 /DNA_END=796 /DNA_ORIENTATION=-
MDTSISMSVFGEKPPTQDATGLYGAYEKLIDEQGHEGARQRLRGLIAYMLNRNPNNPKLLEDYQKYQSEADKKSEDRIGADKSIALHKDSMRITLSEGRDIPCSQSDLLRNIANIRRDMPSIQTDLTRKYLPKTKKTDSEIREWYEASSREKERAAAAEADRVMAELLAEEEREEAQKSNSSGISGNNKKKKSNKKKK